MSAFNDETPTHVDLGPKSVSIVGAGLVGCLLGVYLRKHGFKVEFFEARSDPRGNEERGRSINLVITSRGIHALTSLSEDLAERVMAVTTRVEGRTLHDPAGETVYQSYGPDASYCNFSVSRWELNCVLMSCAEDAGCVFHFSCPLQHIDIPSATLFFYVRSQGQLIQKAVKSAHVFGADGGGSRTRQALRGVTGASGKDIGVKLNYGYKELTMPSLPDGSEPIHRDSLHIWPRGTHFMMALRNRDTSFTMTLYMPETGDEGAATFDKYKTEEEVEAMFKEYYRDAMPLMPQFKEEFMRNPVGYLGTVYTEPWVFEDKFALIGDAAHAFTPFFGQGCNSGFEDVAVLHSLMEEMLAKQGDLDMTALFASYYKARKINTDAIAQMALDNFEEMMSKTADKRFLLEKEIENELSAMDSTYKSRYVLITHSLLPYHLCQEAGVVQESILSQLSENLTCVSDLDTSLAKELLAREWAPFLTKHGITPAHCHYTSKYYEQEA